jgi:multimeric flavodoxin WrbA
MNITVIYGNERKGSTYNIVQLFLSRLRAGGGKLTEFTLPRDMPHFCVGCSSCFGKGEQFCPHREFIAPIQEAMRDADLLIFMSPVYVLRASGQMKALLDHFAFQFMIHRPPEEMFKKTALIVTTAAGGGMGGAMKDVKTSLQMWGVGKIFHFGKAVFATEWAGVSAENKAKIEKRVDQISAKILAKVGRVRPSVKVRLFFHVFRLVHQRMTNSAVDHAHWESRGWLGRKRPWGN